jgi:hypothetical protein
VTHLHPEDSTPETISPADAEALGISEVTDFSDAFGEAVSVELGETYEMVLEGARIEAFLSDTVFVLDPRSPEVRTALRGYAYGLAARGKMEEAKAMMKSIRRQG